MNLRLAEIAKDVAPGRHAVLLVDQAGWRASAKLEVPSNITLMPLPDKRPELDPAENVWEFMRDNGLSNRIFRSYDDLSTIAANPGTTHRATLAHHVPRNATMAARVLINGSWY